MGLRTGVLWCLVIRSLDHGSGRSELAPGVTFSKQDFCWKCCFFCSRWKHGQARPIRQTRPTRPKRSTRGFGSSTSITSNGATEVVRLMVLVLLLGGTGGNGSSTSSGGIRSSTSDGSFCPVQRHPENGGWACQAI